MVIGNLQLSDAHAVHSFTRSRHSLVRSLARAVPQWFQMICNRRIEYWAIRSSAPPLFICSHRSLIRLLLTARFTRAHCSFVCPLAHSLTSELMGKFFVYGINASISFSFSPLCARSFAHAHRSLVRTAHLFARACRSIIRSRPPLTRSLAPAAHSFARTVPSIP